MSKTSAESGDSTIALLCQPIQDEQERVLKRMYDEVAFKSSAGQNGGDSVSLFARWHHG